MEEKSGKEEKQAELPKPPSDWDRCHAWMAQKRRFCRQRPQQPSVYCGNHQHLDTQLATSGRKRVRCPIDPSHLVFEDMVEKHIMICPMAKKRKRQEQQAYFKESVNAGGHGDLCLKGSRKDNTDGIDWAKRLALRVLEVYAHIFGIQCSSKDGTASSKLRLEEIHSSIPTLDLSQPEIDSGIVDAFRTHRIKSGGSRHIPQLASLVGHLRAIEVLPSSDHQLRKEPPVTFLEMGAGRGMFGLTAAGVAAANGVPTELVMVERTGSRSKADKIFRSLPPSTATSYLKLDTVQWSRIECDLAHVNLPDVLEDSKSEGKATSRIVLIAKHLCGAGTDLALKSLYPIRDKVDSCLLATCCHGICDWSLYVGRDYLREAMECEQMTFGPAEFDLMRRWCAGAVSADKSHDEEEQTTAVTTNGEGAPEEKHNDTTKSVGDVRTNISSVVGSLGLCCGVQGLGRACQRLIDHGRTEYLRHVIFPDASSSVELCHYVPPTVSPQNACLICRRHNWDDAHGATISWSRK